MPVIPMARSEPLARKEGGKIDVQLPCYITPRLGGRARRAFRRDLQDQSCPMEVCSLGSTLLHWKHQIAVWRAAMVSQGPTEGNSLIKVVKRAEFGMSRSRNFRIRAPL